MPEKFYSVHNNTLAQFMPTDLKIAREHSYRVGILNPVIYSIFFRGRNIKFFCFTDTNQRDPRERKTVLL